MMILARVGEQSLVSRIGRENPLFVGSRVGRFCKDSGVMA